MGQNIQQGSQCGGCLVPAWHSVTPLCFCGCLEYISSHLPSPSSVGVGGFSSLEEFDKDQKGTFWLAMESQSGFLITVPLRDLGLPLRHRV